MSVVLLSLIAAVAAGALGCFALNAVLVMGGSSAVWLESHRWVYGAALAGGSVVTAVAAALALWPLVSLGGALALTATGRYLWLNV